MSEEDNVKGEKIGPGMHFSTYDSMEEMFADMAKAEARANKAVMTEQAAIRDSAEEQWWVNIVTLQEGLFIAGEAWSLNRARLEELRAHGVNKESELSAESKAEYKYSCRRLADSRGRGYIFGRAYSEIEPEGELGSTHVSQMWPISEAAFIEAREQHWQPDLHDEKKSAKLRTDLYGLWVKQMMRNIK